MQPQQTDVPPPGYPAPAAYPGYPSPGPPKQDRTILVVVVVVIMVVVIALALFAVLFGMTSNLIVPGPTKPVVVFTPANVASGTATFTVAGASQPAAGTDFKVNVAMNGTSGMALNMMGSGVAMPFDMDMGRYTVKVTWMDADGSGTVNAQDMFTVTQVGGFLPGTAYQFFLLWSDGSLIAASNWST